MTEGRRALIAVLQVTTRRFVAARCRVSPQAVSQWASGRKTPSPAARGLLETSYSIPAGSWETRRGHPGRARG